MSFVSLIIILTVNVSAARLPIEGGDDGVWGTLLNEFLNVSLNETGELRQNNLTITQKITFELGEIVDNIVDGILKVKNIY